MSEVKTYIVVPDFHAPYHDPAYINIVTKILKIARPDGLVQLGDAVDFPQLSNFDKDPRRMNSVYDDLMVWKKILDTWDRTLKKGATIDLLEGNHELRFAKYNWRNNPYSIEMVKTIEEILDLDNKLHRTTYHKHERWNSCRIGDVVCHHGFYYNRHLAASLLDKYNCKFIQGHSHRAQLIYRGDIWACSLGHGSLPEVYHLPVPSGHTQCVGELSLLDGVGSLVIIPVDDGRAVYRGKLLDGRPIG